MARRADHTREELRELAITAGLELIQTEGFSNFSARKVATRIGYTVGTLYNVFGSYDGLILHINARTLDDWFEHMQQALKKSRGNELRALANAYIQFSREHYHPWLALFEHHMSDGQDVPDWYRPKLERFFHMAEALLLPLQAGNRKKARRAARILWAGIHGICMLSFSGKMALVDADSAEVLAASFIEHYTAGLAHG